MCVSLARIVYTVSFAGQSPGLCRARLTRVQFWNNICSFELKVRMKCMFFFNIPSGNDIVICCDGDVKWRFWHNVLFWMPFCSDSRPLGSVAGYDFYGIFISFIAIWIVALFVKQFVKYINIFFTYNNIWNIVIGRYILI